LEAEAESVVEVALEVEAELEGVQAELVEVLVEASAVV